MNSSRLMIIAILTIFSLGATSAVSETLPSVEKLDDPYPLGMGDQGSVMGNAPAVDPNESAEFDIRRGEKLRLSMKRWTQTVGYELVWQPEPEEGDIRFASDMTFTGTFAEAANDFFTVVRSQTKFDGRLHSNRVLRVFVANAKQ